MDKEGLMRNKLIESFGRQTPLQNLRSISELMSFFCPQVARQFFSSIWCWLSLHSFDGSIGLGHPRWFTHIAGSWSSLLAGSSAGVWNTCMYSLHGAEGSHSMLAGVQENSLSPRPPPHTECIWRIYLKPRPRTDTVLLLTHSVV